MHFFMLLFLFMILIYYLCTTKPKNMRKIFRNLMLVGMLSIGSLSANATHNPEWLKKAVFYQIYPSSYYDTDKKATMALWAEMREWLDKNYPENILISEWCDPTQSIPAGFNIDFMIHFGTPGYSSMFFQPDTPNGRQAPEGGQYSHCYFEKAAKGTTEIFFKNYFNSYNATKGKGYMAIPTANHDFQRPNIADRNTIDQLKVTQTFIMTMPGVPFIYYGDEIGMKFEMGLKPKEGSAERTGTRTPMQWTNGENAGFSTCAPENIFLPVDTDNGKLTVEVQEKDPNSLLNYTRELIRLRQESKCQVSLCQHSCTGQGNSRHRC